MRNYILHIVIETWHSCILGCWHMKVTLPVPSFNIWIKTITGLTKHEGAIFLGRLWVYQRSDCCSRTVWAPRMLEKNWHCSSSYFVYNFSKTPWLPLMWMVRFVTFVYKDLFFDKYFRSSKGEIHLKILQATPLQPMRFVEVVNKVRAGTMPNFF